MYEELLSLDFEGRVKYLQQILAEHGHVPRFISNGVHFYNDPVWIRVRRNVIIRDKGYDLGILGKTTNRVNVHHIHPLTYNDYDYYNRTGKYLEKMLDESNLITVDLATHNTIHNYRARYYDIKPREEADLSAIDNVLKTHKTNIIRRLEP